MNAYGIEFSHRRASDMRDFVAHDFANFTAFAALADASGCAKNIKSVFYETQTQAFEIDVDEKHKFDDVGGCIDWCANKTLPQYVLFGIYQHKNDLTDPA